jgi:large subunit ribosomal protein L29
MKAKDIRALAADAKVSELTGLLREQFNLRMQKATGQLAAGSKLRKVRRDIARIKTIMSEKTGTGA